MSGNFIKDSSKEDFPTVQNPSAPKVASENNAGIESLRATIKVMVDGLEVAVPKGETVLWALKQVGIEIPHFCYHHELSVAGNCRMCQVKLAGVPKLVLACCTPVSEGMKISTHKTSPEVADAQRETLEFLLINHPLDCTICDQAGQCKLQDYYLQFSSELSRFSERREVGVKAEVLGEEVIYDSERCVNCTRCVRFCNEITKTSELGVFNRGDKAVIGIFPSHPLNNPFSGVVCDLCPVGALTHRRWRFNSRSWQTQQVKTVCPGCATGCVVSVALKDNKIVSVRGVETESDSNHSFLCNEGRYGFSRFQPVERLTMPMIKEILNYEMLGLERLKSKLSKLRQTYQGENAMFISPFLTLEELEVVLAFARDVLGLEPASDNLVLTPHARKLTELEQILISPNYAPNLKAAEIFGLIKKGQNITWLLEQRYQALLRKVRNKKISKLVVVGDYAVCSKDIDSELVAGTLFAEVSVQTSARPVQAKNISTPPSVRQFPPSAGQLNFGALHLGTRAFCEIVLPSRTVLEKTGTLINIVGVEHKLLPLFTPPAGCLDDSEWLSYIKN
ncbi:MAG: (2Fe-2S)-binding protein [Deltaproteobacteria bacterium]|jgi:NADH-quinone oxidoreductase subunit G|nr:(2Fe-2S)-binding protein [Deltaproteobacteria bacterium]